MIYLRINISKSGKNNESLLTLDKKKRRKREKRERKFLWMNHCEKFQGISDAINSSPPCIVSRELNFHRVFCIAGGVGEARVGTSWRKIRAASEYPLENARFLFLRMPSRPHATWRIFHHREIHRSDTRGGDVW